MEINEAFKEYLFLYTQIILQFEKMLTNRYHLLEHPYQIQNSFPRSGILESTNGNFEYSFHGSGCSMTYNKFDIHYDYLITSANYIVVAPWKFGQFAGTYVKELYLVDIQIEEIDLQLERLNTEKLIQRIDPNYLQYQIDFSTLHSFSSLEW